MVVVVDIFVKHFSRKMKLSEEAMAANTCKGFQGQGMVEREPRVKGWVALADRGEMWGKACME